MTQHAVRCLDGLASLGKIGPFGLVADVLRGEFTRNREDHIPAAKALGIVACMLPPPARHAVEMTLAACYGQLDMDRTGSVACARRSAEACVPSIQDVVPEFLNEMKISGCKDSRFTV